MAVSCACKIPTHDINCVTLVHRIGTHLSRVFPGCLYNDVFSPWMLSQEIGYVVHFSINYNPAVFLYTMLLDLCKV